MPSSFDVERLERVVHLRLNRPEARNALSREFWREFPETVRELDAAGATRALVISGAGPSFCAGIDVAAFGPALLERGGDPYARAEAFRHLVASLQDAFSSLAAARFPVIAAIQGHCLGAGVDMIAACCIRVAAADASFGIEEINLAMVADVGSFPRLCHLIPDGWLRELAYTGRRIGATQAKAIGLVNEVHPDHDATVGAALALAAEIAKKSPLAVAGSKAIIGFARDHTVADTLDRVALWQSGMFAPEHLMEAIAARTSQREPAFPDLAPIRTVL